MKMKVLAFTAAAFTSATFGWTDRWDHSKHFDAAGHAQLDCDGASQPASCCICKSIVFEVETQLNNTQNDHDMEIVFRISEEKKQVKYSRSEARILEVLDGICEQVPLELPDSNRKTKRMLSAACNDFVGEYEDELTRTFFDDFTPAKERMCVGTLRGKDILAMSYRHFVLTFVYKSPRAPEKFAHIQTRCPNLKNSDIAVRSK